MLNNGVTYTPEKSAPFFSGSAKRKCTAIMLVLVVLFSNCLLAQYTGGNSKGDKGVLLQKANLGQTLYTGGNGDGDGVYAITANNLGETIYTGGTGDGDVALLSSENLGEGLYMGGSGCGDTKFNLNKGSLGIRIYRGGSYSGFAMGKAFNVSLPISLLSFWGNWQSDDVLLEWATASETNNHHFEVFRSFNGTDFQISGIVNGSGTSSDMHNYSFTDTHVLPLVAEQVYYKLKQVNEDLSYTWTEIIVLNAAARNTESVSVYPNPANEKINVSIEGNKDSAYLLELFNMNGNLVKTISGSCSMSISVQDLAAGSYLLYIFSEKNLIKSVNVIIK